MSKKTKTTPKKRKVRTVEEQLEDAKARVEELERKKALANLKGTEGGKQIMALNKARRILDERGEAEMVSGIDEVIKEIAAEEDGDASVDDTVDNLLED